MISIITPTLNASATIAYCLNNVREQTYQKKEHIIIDGGSTDKTLDIVKERGTHLAKTVSEPDDGMYDAMNKGIGIASGDIIGILNADDYYAHDKVLEHVAKVFENPEIDACYGDLVYVDPTDTDRVVRYWKAGTVHSRSFYRGWMPPHPTFFARKSVYDEFGKFKLNLGTSADYELMLRFILKHGIKCEYLPETLVHMRAGGASSFSIKTRLTANRMDRMAWKANDLRPSLLTLQLKPLRKLGQWLTSPPVTPIAD